MRRKNPNVRCYKLLALNTIEYLFHIFFLNIIYYIYSKYDNFLYIFTSTNIAVSLYKSINKGRKMIPYNTLRLKVCHQNLCAYKKLHTLQEHKNVIPGMSATQDGIQRASASNVLFF